MKDSKIQKVPVQSDPIFASYLKIRSTRLENEIILASKNFFRKILFQKWVKN